VGPGGISGRQAPPSPPWGSASSGEGTVAALLRGCVPSSATRSGLDRNGGWGSTAAISALCLLFSFWSLGATNLSVES
jgi:hypothetical protein